MFDAQEPHGANDDTVEHGRRESMKHGTLQHPTQVGHGGLCRVLSLVTQHSCNKAFVIGGGSSPTMSDNEQKKRGENKNGVGRFVRLAHGLVFPRDKTYETP